MNFWIPGLIEQGEDGTDLLVVAQAAERLGYKGMALIDHVAVPRARLSRHPSGDERIADDSAYLDPFQLAVAMAGRTQRLEFTTYSFVLPTRHPLMVAKQVASAAVLTGGRLTFGLGVGWLREEFDLLDVGFGDRGRRADEMLEIIQAALQTGRVEHAGAHYRIAACSVLPAVGRVPIWIGGMSEAGLKRAVRYDGWMADAHDVEETLSLLRRVNEMRIDSRGDLDGFRCLVAVAAAPSTELFGELERAGATDLIGVPWWPGDPAAATTAGKLGAVEAFADRFLRAD